MTWQLRWWLLRMWSSISSLLHENLIRSKVNHSLCTKLTLTTSKRQYGKLPCMFLWPCELYLCKYGHVNWWGHWTQSVCWRSLSLRAMPSYNVKEKKCRLYQKVKHGFTTYLGDMKCCLFRQDVQTVVQHCVDSCVSPTFESVPDTLIHKGP